MERKFDNQNYLAEMNAKHAKAAGSILQRASESLLANLPILVLGIVVAFAVAGEFFL